LSRKPRFYRAQAARSRQRPVVHSSRLRIWSLARANTTAGKVQHKACNLHNHRNLPPRYHRHRRNRQHRRGRLPLPAPAPLLILVLLPASPSPSPSSHRSSRRHFHDGHCDKYNALPPPCLPLPASTATLALTLLALALSSCGVGGVGGVAGRRGRRRGRRGGSCIVWRAARHARAGCTAPLL
jgi:hypothetical protein